MVDLGILSPILDQIEQFFMVGSLLKDKLWVLIFFLKNHMEIPSS